MKTLGISLLLLVTSLLWCCGPIEPYEIATDNTAIDSVLTNPVLIDSIYQEPELGLKPCITNGGLANDSGLKTWCWQDVDVAPGGPETYSFSNDQLSVSTECNRNQIINVDNRLKFKLDLTKPSAEWCANDFNLRAEISTSPWLASHPLGTEEWFGWTYVFGENYIIDKKNPWAFFQQHDGTTGLAPLISFWVMSEGGPGSGKAGEIHVVNATANSSTYAPTGIIPVAGEAINIVVHIVWAADNTGWLQVWMNQKKVYDVYGATVRNTNPVGGNAKFGIYKWAWREQEGVNSSLQQGITELETFMGPLRIITRLADDPDFGKKSFALVSPN